MIGPRIPVGAVLTAATVLLAGCAAGRWIAGAPAPGADAHAVPAAHASRTPGATALVARRCANCHAAPDPAAMSAEAWTAGLERMKQRMHLPDAEWDSLATLAGTHRGR